MKRTSKILLLFIAIFSILVLAGTNSVFAIADHHYSWRKDVNGDGKPDLVFRKYTTATPKQIEEYVKEICNEIDEPMPIFLNKHFSHLKEFSNTHFQARDFVESIYFDTMIVQIFDENAKKENKNFY